ncbi:AGL325Wp [Eremothecium gossypii ATCC 10895]|uniref:AGL325Wp n=1 Tax=Eremothecium gossypii (strain ATCC 10895 / CBS 109.51 / FGSC 9923 / NRRL Y-1056) TaxID=284811 RepID=Q751M2_EREGS|nr:AGL325Wp [Eremothecium gossypii ATCC 10895]AAS54166.2 AGL325Wp [Eremothecium gossypii ATCC 10895]AEY98492.1 FAGL325Wp [Eremothecium gossypii FDAG1]
MKALPQNTYCRSRCLSTIAKQCALWLILILPAAYGLGQANSSVTSFECNVRKCSFAPWAHIQFILKDTVFRNAITEKLRHAVQIPSEMLDPTPNPVPDPRVQPEHDFWDPFRKLHQQLTEDFPRVFSTLQVETINEFSLLITWEGSDSNLKPLMFSSHMDVVPVNPETAGEWRHDPYSGDLTWDEELGDILWGRGAFDDKHRIVAHLQAIEYILTFEPKFVPKRTIILAFGSDEESGGVYGASFMAALLLSRYGENGLYAVVDEGFTGIRKVEGVLAAMPAISEKGRMNFWCNITMSGGHSSVPHKDSAINLVSKFITEFEREQLPPTFSQNNPAARMYQCIAENSVTLSNSLKTSFASAFNDSEASDHLLEYIFSANDLRTECLFRSVKGVTTIHGGMKSNSIADFVAWSFNVRLAMEDDADQMANLVQQMLCRFAQTHGIGLSIQGKQVLTRTKKGLLQVRYSAKNAAPISPSNAVWEMFAGTIKGLYEESIFPLRFNSKHTLLVLPSIMTGGTDSVHYERLTSNIYRYQPGFYNGRIVDNIHGPNEFIDINTLIETVAFVYAYIHSAQE